jgi:hypothetical protein
MTKAFRLPFRDKLDSIAYHYKTLIEARALYSILSLKAASFSTTPSLLVPWYSATLLSISIHLQ